jgi:hypothetical protein
VRINKWLAGWVGRDGFSRSELRALATPVSQRDYDDRYQIAYPDGRVDPRPRVLSTAAWEVNALRSNGIACWYEKLPEKQT